MLRRVAARATAVLGRRGAHTVIEPLVKYHQVDKVGVITLNAPATLNALTAAMGDELGALLNAIDTSTIGAVVVTGAGKAFSSGGSLDFLRDRSNDTGSRNAAIMRDFYRRFLQIRGASSRPGTSAITMQRSSAATRPPLPSCTRLQTCPCPCSPPSTAPPSARASASPWARTFALPRSRRASVSPSWAW